MPVSNNTISPALSAKLRILEEIRAKEERKIEVTKQRNAEKSKRCRQKNRQAGLCSKCGKPSEKFRCDKCQKVHNETTKQLRDERIQEGKCEKCGGDNTTDTTRCVNCQKRLNQQRREKNQEYTKQWAANNAIRGLCISCSGPKENQKIRRCEKCKRKCNSNRLKSLYGITVEEYEELSAHQNHVCWICGKKETTKDGYLHVDHCHKTGKIRGLLCGLCNRGIGALGDSIELLEKAIEYLKEFKD